MPKIDKLLETLHDKNVEKAVLKSEKPIQLWVKSQCFSGSITPANQLLEIMREVTPPHLIFSLENGGAFHFVRRFDTGNYEFGVESFAGSLSVTVTRGKPDVFSTLGMATVTNTVPVSSIPRELFVHQNGTNIGPLSPEEAQKALEAGQFQAEDLAITPTNQNWRALSVVLDEWRTASSPQTISSANQSTLVGQKNQPLSALFEATIAQAATGSAPVSSSAPNLRRFLNEEQDESAVARVIERLMQICVAGEDVLYIAVQKKLVSLNLSPGCVALTTKRVIFFRPTAFGLALTFHDYFWRDIADVHLSEAILGAVFSVRFVNGTTVGLDNLPKAQARKLYQFGQQMEEQMHFHRRDLMLEEKKAGAASVSVSVGNVNAPAENAPPINAQLPPSSNAIMEKLKVLKDLHEQNLISDEEYAAKKAELMAQF